MKKILWIAAILLLLAAGLWWWHRSGGDTEGDEAKPTAAVEVAPAVEASIGRTLVAYGVVDSSASGARTVTLAYDCVVRSVAAPAGSRVSPGAVLLVVEPTPDARLQLDSARGVAALAARSLASVRERYDLRLATDDDLRTAEQADQDAQLKRESLEKRGLGDSAGRLVSPVAGIVVKLDAQPGAIVPAGTALATIAGSGQLEVKLEVEAADAAAIRAGQPVTINAVNRPAAPAVRSTVGATGALADAATGALEVRVPLPADSDWFPGEHARAEIETERKTALVVPRSAVLPEDDQEILYTVAGGKAVKHAVRVGIASGETVEVSAPDLKAGDAVVTQGNYELEDGMAVQLADKSAPADDRAEAKP